LTSEIVVGSDRSYLPFHATSKISFLNMRPPRQSLREREG